MAFDHWLEQKKMESPPEKLDALRRAINRYLDTYLTPEW
jgi:hypothetical protein